MHSGMKLDSRLSRMLHILIHMARADGPITSQAAAEMLESNAVVVRRTMAGLRDAGLVHSVKGHGGGWTITAELDQITMLQVYRAVGEPRIFSIGLADPNPACLVEQAVNASMDAALKEAEAALVARLGEVTLADIAKDFERRFALLGDQASDKPQILPHT